MIGKSALAESMFMGPVAAVLRSYEDAIDVSICLKAPASSSLIADFVQTFSYGVIDSAEACQADATMRLQSLDKTLADAECAYTPAGTLSINILC